MNKEKISTALGEIADKHITFKKAAACIALIIASSLGVTGITFAANADFRNAVVKLFSSFSEEEKISIRNGHMTSSLDMEDALIEFLHNFNDKNMGHGEKVQYGDYKFLKESIENVNVIVACESVQYKLLVNMKGEEIEDGVMAWKAASYQLISSKEADKL